MDKEVGFDGFVEGGLEGFDQIGWEILDEADGVGEQNFFAAVSYV